MHRQHLEDPLRGRARFPRVPTAVTKSQSRLQLTRVRTARTIRGSPAKRSRARGAAGPAALPAVRASVWRLSKWVAATGLGTLPSETPRRRRWACRTRPARAPAAVPGASAAPRQNLRNCPTQTAGPKRLWRDRSREATALGTSRAAVGQAGCSARGPSAVVHTWPV